MAPQTEAVTSSPFALASLFAGEGSRRRGGSGLLPSSAQPSASGPASAAAPAAAARAALARLNSVIPAQAAPGAAAPATSPPRGAGSLASSASASATSPGPGSLVAGDPLSQAASRVEADATPPASICQCRECTKTFPGSGRNNQLATTAPKPVSGAAVTASVDLASTFKLHSNPKATKTIYLDFDGNITTGTWWNSSYGQSTISTPKFDFDGNVNVFSNAELERIQFIWQRVAEDFAPFDVNITTEDPGTAALTKGDVAGDTTWGARAAIGGSSFDWFGSGAGGVSYLNVFGNPVASPSFVFTQQLGNGDEKYTAEAISHEIGHALGLQHDGNSTNAYYSGQGSGSTSWAPIMGVGYYSQVTQWSKGEYAGANMLEDDLAIITTKNGFGYRSDDVGNSSSTATALSGLSFSQYGIIETNTDADWFSFRTGSGMINLSIASAALAWVNNGAGSFTPSLLNGRSSNLDIEARLYQADGVTLVATSNPLDSLSAAFNLSLAAGTYFLKVDGIGYGDPLSTGYTNYASLGQYLISGSVAPTATLIVSAPALLSTNESGASTRFSVRLSQAPTAEVVVNLTLSDTSEALLSTSQLRFDPGNWSTDQTVTVSGRDDLLVDGSQAFTLTLSASSSDPAFQALPATVLQASNADNDLARTVDVAPSLGNLVANVTYSSGNSPSVNTYVTASAVAGDGQVLQIREGLLRSSGGSSSTSGLDGYQWHFDNLVNATELLFDGYRSANTQNDNFQLLLSTDNGTSWRNLLSVSNTTLASQTVALGTSVNGSALIKAVDTNRTAGNTAIDTLFVDRIALRGQLTDLRPDLSVTTTSSQAVEASGSEAVFTISRGGDTSSALDVGFSLSGTAGAGVDYTLTDQAGSLLANSVRIAAGQSVATVRLRPVADALTEGSEGVQLTLQAPGDMLKLGRASDTAVIVDSLTGQSTTRLSPYPVASAETPLLGSVSGSFTAVAAADGVVETIREVLGGSVSSATSQLEHRWTFQNLSNVSSLAVKASTSGGDDQFRFQYSTSGSSSSWKTINTLASNFSGVAIWNLGTTLTANLLYVRVVDTDRTAGKGLIDSISIDALTLLTSTSPQPF